jgi:hypothetical protein
MCDNWQKQHALAMALVSPIKLSDGDKLETLQRLDQFQQRHLWTKSVIASLMAKSSLGEGGRETCHTGPPRREGPPCVGSFGSCIA